MGAQGQPLRPVWMPDQGRVAAAGVSGRVCGCAGPVRGLVGSESGRYHHRGAAGPRGNAVSR
jgi:hypothetical protein